MSTPVEGGCFCKAVRYRLHREPMFVNCCHCLNCQCQTGSAFVINAVIETDQVELLSGELVVSEVVSGRGGPHDIFRCSECGVAVWSRYERREGMRLVRVCTLDDPTTFEPQAHIFTRSKHPWITLPEGVPSFEAMYKTQDVWPEESFKRAMAAMSKS